MLTRKEQSLLEAIEQHAQDKGVEIVTLEIVGAKKAPTIRVYIDTENGVGFDELSSAQAWMGDLMDEIDPFPGAYTLEVSSPGIDRPLRTPDHFDRFSGETCVIKTTGPIEGRNSFTGILGGMRDESVLVTVDGEEYSIPFDMVKKANIKGTFEFRS